VVSGIESHIREHLKVSTDRPRGITNWISYIGYGGARFVLSHNPKAASPNYALLVINCSSADVIDEAIKDLEHFTFDRFPDLQVKFKRIETGAAIENPVEVRISGTDENKLFELVDRLKAKMAQVSGLRNISDDWGQRTKKLQVKIDQQRALRAGVTSEDIAVSLQTGLSGLQLTEYRDGDEIIPVMLRSVAADRQDIGKLEALAVYAQATGVSVPLKQVADIKVVWEPAKILRRNRLKTVTVGAQLEPGFTASEGFSEITPWLEEMQTGWDLGYQYELGGDAESSGKANQSIVEKLPIAAFIIIILLVAQFNSLRKPLIILVTIPLGVIGVIFGLLLAHSFFGFMALLGIISLAGIVINNAIVLLERIKYETDINGLTPQAGIIEAAQRRMVPILLTTATTVLGLIPLYLGGGEMWEPMAVAIMGGLLFSTLLTLCVVPVLYALLYRVSYKESQPA
jgi:multidrug efflux pump subunit AcrB